MAGAASIELIAKMPTACAMTAIFAKIGIQGVDSDLATLVRTGINIGVLSAFVWFAGKWSNPFCSQQGPGCSSACLAWLLALPGCATSEPYR
jgi:hypothetical protein